jgi:hypothetical protein
MSFVWAVTATHAHASPILGLDFASEDATVVWDGTATVATANNLGILGTQTGLYSSLGLTDPQELAVELSLTGVSTIEVNQIAILLSNLEGPCLNCTSIRSALSFLGLPLPGSSNLDSPVIVFFAPLIGPSVAQDGDVFRLSTADQAILRSILLTPGFGPDELVIGLSVDSDRARGLGGIFLGTEVWTVTAVPVPEPGTALLLVSGLIIALATRRSLKVRR